MSLASRFSIVYLEPQSHTRRVLSLYKRALRNLESYYHQREVYRYYAVHLRQRFAVNKSVQDKGAANHLLESGEKMLDKYLHSVPKKFALSPGGCAFEREVEPPDWVLDYWHPLEKAQYPAYFARREERKREFYKKWMKIYCPESAAN